MKERKERQAEEKRTLIENMHYHVHKICAVSLKKVFRTECRRFWSLIYLFEWYTGRHQELNPSII